MYKSWVTYSIAVYIGFLLAGALVGPRSSSSVGAMDELYLTEPPIMVEVPPTPIHPRENLTERGESAAARS